MTPFDGAETAPGLNGQSVDVEVAPTVVSSFTLSYTVADAAGNQASAFVDVRIVPANEVNRPPTARTDLGRTRSGVAVVIDAVGQRLRPRRRPHRRREHPLPADRRHGERRGRGCRLHTEPTFVGTDRLTYALVDAGGEIAIGEVLIGVMPAAGANRAPEAFDDKVQAVAGSAPLVYDVLANDSDPDGDHAPRHRLGHAVERRDEGRRPKARGRVHPAEGDRRRQAGRCRLHLHDRRRARRDRRATVTVHVVDAAQAIPPIAVDDRVGPLSPGQSVDVDVLANDLDPDGNPAELVVSASRPGAGRSRTLARSPSPPARRRPGTRTRSPTPTVSPTPARSTCSSCTTGHRRSRPYATQTTADAPIDLDLAGQATDPDGDTLYYACCDNPHGGSAATAANGAGQLKVTFTPDQGFSGPATFAYTVDDQQGHTVSGAVTIDVLAPSNRPPVAKDNTLAVEAGTPTNIDLAALVSDPDVGEQLTYSISGSSAGAVTLTQSGANVQASAPIDATDKTDSFTYTVTDSAGPDGERHGVAHGAGAVGATAAGPRPTR